MEDEKIIDLYFERNENAVTETALKYGRMLRAIAYGILKNHQDSEECENDTWCVEQDTAGKAIVFFRIFGTYRAKCLVWQI